MPDITVSQGKFNYLFQGCLPNRLVEGQFNSPVSMKCQLVSKHLLQAADNFCLAMHINKTTTWVIFIKPQPNWCACFTGITGLSPLDTFFNIIQSKLRSNLTASAF